MNSVLDFAGFFLYVVYRIIMIPISAVLYVFLTLVLIYGQTHQLLNYIPKLVHEVRLQLHSIKQPIHFKKKPVFRFFSHS